MVGSYGTAPVSPVHDHCATVERQGSHRCDSSDHPVLRSRTQQICSCRYGYGERCSRRAEGESDVIEPHDASERRPLRVLPWWVAVIGVTAVAVSITVTTLWLLAIAGHDPSLRIEAIKTG